MSAGLLESSSADTQLELVIDCLILSHTCCEHNTTFQRIEHDTKFEPLMYPHDMQHCMYAFVSAVTTELGVHLD